MNSVNPPILSIILASQNAEQSVEKCLREIKNQQIDGIEVIIVDNSTNETAESFTKEFPHIIYLKAPENKLIPELWGIGIQASKGKLLALTTTHFVPAKTWISEIIRAHQLSYDGIGGAIENDSQAGIISWAIYFCRYSRYMLPFSQEKVEDFAADNASYKRESLNQVKDSMLDGFWEFFVHQEMKKKNMKLLLSPEIIVYHYESFDFWGFLKQRFFHGKQFGSARLNNISSGKRIVLILLSPLIPVLYVYRITKRVFTKKRRAGKYFLSFPVLFVFLISWSVGEFCGYLDQSASVR